MQRGKVVYVAEVSQIPPEIDIEAELEKLGMDARWNLASASSPGWFSPLDATLELVRRGAHGVDFHVAGWLPGSGLHIADHSERIMG